MRVSAPSDVWPFSSALQEAPIDRPLMVPQHHPCGRLGIPAMDRIKLSNAAEELAVSKRVGREPDLMLHGHVHRPISGVWAGIPFHTQRALSHQVHYDEVTETLIPGTHEAPDLVILTVIDGDIAVHTRSYLYDGPVYSMNEQANIDATTPAEIQPLTAPAAP
ncbi:MAG: hypothetical protein AAF675_06150 [Pseudomonadota bacterium]